MFVKKHGVAVRISQFGHDPLDGMFCVAPAPDPKNEGRTVLELLNSDRRVIPFIVSGDGSVILLTRVNLDWVMAQDHDGSGLILPDDYIIGREEPVEIEFMNGTTIDGILQMALDDEDTRASDFLNGPADFYPVLTRMGTLLVNKARVRSTRLSTISPQWKPRANASAQGATTTKTD
jgi:hypothetical protein